MKKNGALPLDGWLKGHRFFKSIWVFPAILTIILLLLTGLKISGSSLEIYNWILGEPQGRSLVANEPEAIRSDEWLLMTQMTIAQKNNGYKEINKNIGNGQDMSIISAVPYKSWSTLFKPGNWAFFLIPFNYAFAFKWWLMAYLLILSCYFFILAVLPNKRLWASLLSLALFFSPFIQWWYQLSTLASIYYGLIILTLFIYLLRAKSTKARLLLSAGIAYTSTALILILYPPFLIACGFGAGMVGIGWLIEAKDGLSIKELWKRLAWVLGALAVALVITLIFVKTRSSEVHAITHTAYPGKRSVPGGGIGLTHLFAGFLDTQLQNIYRAAKYGLNQSENSNFLLIAPFLFIPSIYILMRKYRHKHTVDWPLLFVNLALLLFIIRLTSTILDPVFNLFLFDKVPARRLLIGLGLINLVEIVIFIRALRDKALSIAHWKVIAYCGLVLIFEVAVALRTHAQFPGYIGATKAIALAIPLAVVVYLILRAKFVWALALFLVLSFFSTYKVNPLYRGTGPLTATPLSTAIQSIKSHSNGKWIAEGVQFENFPLMNGAPSLSGTYDYPQPEIWKNLPPQNPYIYNRYAHVVFVLDHTDKNSITTHLELEQDDMFAVVTEPCSNFIRKNNVRYILAQAPIDNSCVNLVSEVPYPNQTFFIYHIN